jgi:alkylation response protein AidB-like acyl-CoA dehydrogenase
LDFELNDEQRSIGEAVAALLEQHAGPARAIDLAATDEYDEALAAALRDAGYSGIVGEAGSGALEATLVVEAIARAAGVVSAGAEILDSPLVAGRALPGPGALASADVPGPIRFGAQARTLLLSDGDVARVVALAPGEVSPVTSSFGCPMGNIDARSGRGESLGPGSGPRLRDWWRLAIAAETVGAMRAALEVTIDYVKGRRQFGHAIGSFQGVQHRLAQCAISVEGSRWLALEAAFKGAPAEGAATAAAYAAAAANQVFGETHQLSGAIGYTREHDLHVWSMRLQALRLEMGGVSGHRRAIVEQRWGKK